MKMSEDEIVKTFDDAETLAKQNPEAIKNLEL